MNQLKHNRWAILSALLFSTAVASCHKAEPPALIHSFSQTDIPITAEVTAEGENGWKVVATRPWSVRFFEVTAGLCEKCRLEYRAQVKTGEAAGKVYLEMWVRVPGKGEFFSRGLDQPLTGTNNWTSLSIPFFLKKGERPDLAKLNLVLEGTGTAWIRNVELWKGPLE